MVERLNPGQAASMPEMVGKPATRPRLTNGLAPMAANLPANAGGKRDVANSGSVGAVRSLVKEMAAAPPVAADRVAALRQQIQGGSYALDTARLADAMIRSEIGSR